MLQLIKLYYSFVWMSFVTFSFNLTNMCLCRINFWNERTILIMQNWGSLCICEYFNIHRTTLYVRKLGHILTWLTFLAFNLLFFYFSFSFWSDFHCFQWKACKSASCWTLLLDAHLLLETGWVEILSCKKKMHLVKLSLSGYYTGCFITNVICIKSGLKGSRTRTNHSTGSNLSIHVNRVYCLLKQLASYSHWKEKEFRSVEKFE